jgi:hypothetical protein
MKSHRLNDIVRVVKHKLKPGEIADPDKVTFVNDAAVDVLRDSQLSLGAKGVFGFMLSLPPDHAVTLDELCERCPVDSKDGLASALNELKSHGHIEEKDSAWTVVERLRWKLS